MGPVCASVSSFALFRKSSRIRNYDTSVYHQVSFDFRKKKYFFDNYKLHFSFRLGNLLWALLGL